MEHNRSDPVRTGLWDRSRRGTVEVIGSVPFHDAKCAVADGAWQIKASWNGRREEATRVIPIHTGGTPVPPGRDSAAWTRRLSGAGGRGRSGLCALSDDAGYDLGQVISRSCGADVMKIQLTGALLMFL